MRLRRILPTAAAATLLLAGLAACGGGDDPANVAATPTPSPSGSPVEPVAAGPTGWEEQYSHAELVAYENALSRWQEYSDALGRIYKRGKNTPTARATMREYSLGWQGEVAVLDKFYDKGGLRGVRGPKPVWSRPKRVIMNRDGTGTVIIEQCTDYRHVLVLGPNGKPADVTPKHPVTPMIINMTTGWTDAGTRYDWSVADVTVRDKKSCAAA